MTMAAPLRIAVLGCGRIGQMHAELLARRSEEIADGVDHAQDRRRIERLGHACDCKLQAAVGARMGI